jgi:cytochrome P450
MGRGPLPPGPKGHLLFGHTLPLLRDPLTFARRWAREYGDVVRLRVGPMVVYLVSHPDDIERVLRSDHRRFRKDRMTRQLSALLGQGLLTGEGDLWRQQRLLAQPAFQAGQIERYSTFMVALTRQVLKRWQPGDTRDLHTDLMRLTLAIIGQALFGADMEDMADTVGRILDIGMNFFASPVSLFPWLYWLPLPANRRFRRACHELDDLMYAAIARRRARGGEGEDLLGRLLAVRADDGSAMTDRQLRDELVTLFLAGHETTALALSYTFYLLSSHADARARLEAELDEVLQGQPPTVADLPRLPYAEGVIKESMRLYPPAPGVGREALEDCEIGGYFVPQGMQISLLQWVVHRDPRWFEAPDEFRPQRWTDDLVRRLPRCAYFPFGDGPRICIGQQLAMIEAVLILATIAQQYRLEVPADFRLDLLMSVTLRPKQGMPVVVHARQSAE